MIVAACLALLSLASLASASLYPVLSHDFVNDRTPFEQVKGTPYSQPHPHPPHRRLLIDGASPHCLASHRRSFAIGCMRSDVTFNGRAVAINGQNVFLSSGSIHYPRSTPEMWPHLMANSRAGGLNMVQIYVFWYAQHPPRHPHLRHSVAHRRFPHCVLMRCVRSLRCRNYHEWHYRQYDFTTENRNLGAFLQAAADAGLFVNLRIGPFVCAEVGC